MNHDLTINTINDFNRTLETFRSNDPAEIDAMMVALRSIYNPAFRLRVSAHLLQRVDAISAFLRDNNPTIHHNDLAIRNFCYVTAEIAVRYEDLKKLKEQLANPGLLQRIWNTGASVFRQMFGSAPLVERAHPVPLNEREIDIGVITPIQHRLYIMNPDQYRQHQARLLARLEATLATVPDSIIKKAHDFNVYINAIKNYSKRRGFTPGLEQTFNEIIAELFKEIEEHHLNQKQCDALVVAYPSLAPFRNHQ